MKKSWKEPDNHKITEFDPEKVRKKRQNSVKTDLGSEVRPEDIEDLDLEFVESDDGPGEEEFVWEDTDQEEEADAVKPWMVVLLVLGLTVLTAIICAVLWYYAHPDKQESKPGLTGEGTETAESPDDAFPDRTPLPSDETTAGAGEGESLPLGEEQESLESVSGTDQDTEEQGIFMSFADREDFVTPKEAVNLRSAPTTADDGNIVVQVKNGEVLTRTGINEDSGWSRLEYGGQTVYAVSQYLTQDMEYSSPSQTAPDNPNRVNTAEGRTIDFTNCDDWISPKEYVNLRTEPSTSQGNDTVSCRMEYGDKAHRTGYSEDSGWSRVEYDGKVLYVVTSLIYEVEP